MLVRVDNVPVKASGPVIIDTPTPGEKLNWGPIQKNRLRLVFLRRFPNATYPVVFTWGATSLD